MNANALDSLSFDELVPSNSKYLQKQDVGEDGLILTIKGFSYADVNDDNGNPEQKVVMHFAEDVKPMILNRTNSSLIPVATGARNAGEARGKKIVVFNDPTIAFGGKITGGLRIKRIPGPPRAAAAPKGAQTVTTPFQDDEPSDIPI